eukprot:GSChrysophyteH1.ASY1.ANO1.1069.1 assembled CDS
MLFNRLIARNCKVSSLTHNGKINRLVHSIASEGFQDANNYDSARPGYPLESVAKMKEILIQNSSAKSHCKVLEIGAGTGKYTTSFFADNSHQDCTFEYTATDPSAAFLKKLQINAPKAVHVVSGTGDCIPADDNSLDGIVIAQAFHWMDNEETLCEIHRVLKPGGSLVMIWNSMDVSKNWIAELEYRNMEWEQIFYADVAESKFMLPLQKWKAPNNNIHLSTKQEIIDILMSISVIARRDASEKKQIKEEVQYLLNTHPDTRDATEDDKLPLEYVSDIAWCTKI